MGSRARVARLLRLVGELLWQEANRSEAQTLALNPKP